MPTTNGKQSKKDVEIVKQLKKVELVTKKLRETLREILKLKVSDKAPNMLKHQTSVYMLFLELKQLNRRIKGLSQEGKNRVQLKKKYMDSVGLKLESILYEKSYFQKRINKFQEFGLNLKKITLRSKEDFLQDSPEFKDLSEHDLELKRFADELKERKRFIEERNVLLREKKKVLMKLNQHKKKLFIFKSKITTINRQIVPLLRMFPSPPIVPQVKDPLVQQLPPALYNLYYIALHHRTSFQADLMIVIKDRRNSKAANGYTNKTGSLQPHPLHLILDSKRKNVHISFSFEYISDLRVVALKALSSSTIPSSGLVNLYPGDSGRIMPRQDSVNLKENQIGMLYSWIQSLCGLHHPKSNKGAAITPKVTLDDVLRRVHVRGEVLFQLQKQYSFLKKKSHIFGLTCTQFPVKPASVLTKWSFITAEEYTAAIGEDEVDEEATDAKDSDEIWVKKYNKYIHFIITYKEVPMDGYISIRPDYPVQPAVFTIDMKDIETKVNNLPEEFSDEAEERDNWMLSYQVRKCQEMFEKMNPDTPGAGIKKTSPKTSPKNKPPKRAAPKRASKRSSTRSSLRMKKRKI